MFGRPQNSAPQPPAQPALCDIGRIQGGGLVQIIVTNISPLTFYLFLNDKAVDQIEVESLTIDIHAPSADSPEGAVQSMLSRYTTSVTGERATTRTPLLPATIEIVVSGRRLLVTGQEPDSVEGLWISAGLQSDGTAQALEGLQDLRVVISDSIFDARITWTDGTAESLLPT